MSKVKGRRLVTRRSEQADAPPTRVAAGCQACVVKGEMIEHLREINRQYRDDVNKLSDRLLSMVPEAARQYQQMSMAASIGATGGSPAMLPVGSDGAMIDDDARAIDSMWQQFVPQGMQGGLK